MASISSLGVGSNLDLNGLLDQLASAERQPLVQLQRQQVSFTAKLSAYGTLRDALETLRGAATRLADPNTFQGVKAAASPPDIASASASAAAAPGSYQVEVLQLPSTQTLAATGVTDPAAPIGRGTLTLDFGRISGGAFDADTGRYTGASFAPDAGRPPVSVVIDAGNDSLHGLRDTINRTPGLGVTASVVRDGSAAPYRLVLSPQTTGEQGSLRIAVAGDASLSTLVAHDPAGTQSLQQTATAASARLKVNGVAISAASATVADAIPGVTLNLTRTGSTTLNVGRDTASAESAVNGLVSAFNALRATSSQLSRYDTEKKSGSALTGDAVLRSVQTGVRGALTVAKPGTFATLSAVGVSFQKDGSLSLDAPKLRAALAQDREAVATLFAGASAASGAGGPGGGSAGVATDLAALVARFTGQGGLLGGAAEGVKSTLKSLDTRYAALEEGIQSKVARYRAQFNQLDQLMSRMNSTTAYLAKQFDAMSAPRK